jgi:putative copper export protein/methionine-rich copper-binding protein CopC
LHKKNSKVYHCFWLIFIIIIIISSILLLSISELPFLPKKAYAHSIPISQTPSHDSILNKEELPSKVVIDFSERPIPGVSTIQVLNEKNERVDNGNFVIIGDHDREAMTTLDTKKLTDGVYTVSWMTQSADDGHIAKGSYVFGIGNVGQSSSSSSAATSTSPMGLANGEQRYQVQAITSSLDGLIKWPLIISQITVIGVIFSHLFLWELFGKKIIVVNINQRSDNLANNTNVNNTMTNLRYNKRFSLILVAVSVTIIIASNILLFLQITELSPINNNNDISSYTSIFLSLLHGPSGFVWVVRITTSIVIIISSVLYYYYYSIKKTKKIESKTGPNNQYQLEKRLFYKIKKNENLFPLTLLAIAFVAGSMSILANSMTSHNAAVDFFPSVAVSLDWLHFMAISVWVGGLFYLSTVLLGTIRNKINDDDEIGLEHISSQKTTTRIPNEIFSINVKKRFIFNYYLALLLPRFSIVATLSLGIIGISGIYMAWININNFNFLFNSEYGNILIIKLITIIPLILLGGFHQLKLHNTIVKVASLGRNTGNISRKNNIDNKNSIDLENPKKDAKQEGSPEKIIKGDKIDIFGKFNKTIKIESLVAIGVLLVASLLTITSPPTTSMSMPSMDEGSHTMVMSDGNVMTMNDMSMSNFKNNNNSYVKEVKILDVNTKIEINPFYSGFNTFKITFTDTNGQPYSKILTVRMIFKNDQADIGPITTKLFKVSPGVYTIRGGYISQPGEWNVAMAAQRPSDYDLNYRFNPTVNSSSSSSSSSSAMTQTSSNNSSNNTDKAYNMNNTDSRFVPVFDSFTFLAITLAVIIGITSYYFNKKSKEKLRETIDLLAHLNHNKKFTK